MSEVSSDPILSCAEALAYEGNLFRGDPEQEWNAMNRAGEAVADAALRDMRELRTIPHRPRLLVLAGKGHNGGDALIAAKRFLRTIPTARAVVWPWSSKEVCRALTGRAFEELIEFASNRTEVLACAQGTSVEEIKAAIYAFEASGGFDLLIDGLLGMQSKPGLHSPMKEWISMINSMDAISVRVAVDLPSGITDSVDPDVEPVRVDFTYCPGIVKRPVILPENLKWIGRARYLDLGFFDASDMQTGKAERVLRTSSLRCLRRLRPTDCDKRDFGRLLAVIGSRKLGGAALMCARGALNAGVGLLTCCVPESLHASFVAACPEAMWVPVPESPEGSMALEGLGLIRQHLSAADALVVGPGIGPDQESHSLVREVVKLFSGPILLDADALRPRILDAIEPQDNLVLTPHAGEIKRLAEGLDPMNFARSFAGVVLAKGSRTVIFGGGRALHLFCGSSLLARGGSGDLLSGIVSALMARGNRSNLDCAALGALWHAKSAEALARQHGQEAVTVGQVAEYMSFALRNDF